MRLPFTALTIFAEDARDELRGQTSLIGILPNNITVPAFPGGLAKLAFYTRVQIPIDVEPDPISVFARDSAGQENKLGDFDADLIKRAQQEALDLSLPAYGIILQTIASPFAMAAAGRVDVIVRSGAAEEISGSLRFIAVQQPEAEQAGG